MATSDDFVTIKKNGFKINRITMRNMDTAETMLEEVKDFLSSDQIHCLHVPRRTFDCERLSREINFSSVEGWKNMKVNQTLWFKGAPLLEWTVQYGPVAPNTCNTWAGVTHGSDGVGPWASDDLNGKALVVAKFYDDQTLINTLKIKILYV